jgi:tyrosinase
MANGNESGMTRRALLTGGAAVAAMAAVAALPGGRVLAQAPARYRRFNVASPEGQAMLVSYEKAVRALLQLPPTDPRNWYRLAFVHYLDCPHGNWWLFPWHRGFTGWAEEIVRQASGNPDFAFPFWDWTANPEVPAAMSMGALTPTDPAFIQDINAFTAAFQPALAAATYWKNPQLEQLQYRCISSNAVLWDQLTDPTNPNWPSFFPAQGGGQNFPNVRNPNRQLDCVTASAVSATTLASAMAAQDYMTFSSPEAQQHSGVIGFAILEGQPHNMVHNNTGGVVYPTENGQCGLTPTNTGGFMQAFLSPVDPLFYLHHSNIDRLWNVWTQTQTANGNPNILPPADLYDQWATEPFLFFVQPDGTPVTQTQAGDYATIGQFNYDYGSGSTGMPKTALRTAGGRRPPVQRFAGETPPPSASKRLLATGSVGSVGATAVRLKPALLNLARPNAGQHLLAKVTLAFPHVPRGQTVSVLVHTGDPAGSVEVGRVSMFGHSMDHGLLTFTLPLDEGVAALRRRHPLTAGGFLYFHAAVPPGAVAAHHGVAKGSEAKPMEVRVHSVIVEAH